MSHRLGVLLACAAGAFAGTIPPSPARPAGAGETLRAPSGMGLVQASNVPCDDLADPGNPRVKTDWRRGLREFPADTFDFDPAAYVARSQKFHGTEVIVAIHHSVAEASDIDGHPVPAPRAFADRVFNAFHQYWHVFGGFVYDRYTIKINAPSDPQTFQGASEVGVVAGATRAQGVPPHYYVRAMADEFLPHEMFHAWNGRITAYEPNGSGNLFQLETWIAEGATVFYAAWVEGVTSITLAGYREFLQRRLSQHDRLVGTEFDLSIEELARRIGRPNTLPPPSSQYQDMLFARAALISYLLDLELARAGASLDVLLRKLYEEFGLTGRRYRQTDVPRLLQEATGNRFEEFFNAFLHTNTRLRVDPAFRLVDHPSARAFAFVCPGTVAG